MSAQPQLTKDNAPLILRHFIELANTKGAYLLRESHLLKKAIDYINPDVKSKPSFTENDANPRSTALRLLVQGAHKAQQQGSFRIEDSSFLYTVCEMVEKELESSDQEVVQKQTKGASPENDAQEEDDEIDVRPITVTKKSSKRFVETD